MLNNGRYLGELAPLTNEITADEWYAMQGGRLTKGPLECLQITGLSRLEGLSAIVESSIPTIRLDKRRPASGEMITTLRLATRAVQLLNVALLTGITLRRRYQMRSFVLLCFTLKRSRVCTIAIPLAAVVISPAIKMHGRKKKNGWADRLLHPQYSHLSAGKT